MSNVPVISLGKTMKKAFIAIAALLLSSCSNSGEPNRMPAIRYDSGESTAIRKLEHQTSLSLPYKIGELPSMEPLREGISFVAAEGVESPILYHGTFHGYDVFTEPRKHNFGYPFFYSKIGPLTFGSGDYFGLYCHKADPEYTIRWISGGAMSTEDIEPLVTLYCAGEFNDNDLLKIMLQQASLADGGAIKVNPSLVEGVNEWTVSEVGYQLGQNVYQQGFPFEGKRLVYESFDAAIPASLKETLSKKENKRAYWVGNGLNGETQMQGEIESLSSAAIYLGELGGFSFFADKMSEGNSFSVEYPNSYAALRRAFYFPGGEGRTIFGYRDGASYSLGYLFRAEAIGKDELFEINQRVFSYLAEKEEDKEAYAESFLSDWIEYYRDARESSYDWRD